MRFLFRTVLSFQLRILITILFFGCESKPVQIDLGESGHQLMVVSIDSSQFQSILRYNQQKFYFFKEKIKLVKL